MTREGVEQAIEAIKLALGDYDNHPDFDGIQGPNCEACDALTALTTLSNALAESEKERERLKTELHDAREELLLGPEAFKAAQFWDKVQQLEESEEELRDALAAKETAEAKWAEERRSHARAIARAETAERKHEATCLLLNDTVKRAETAERERDEAREFCNETHGPKYEAVVDALSHSEAERGRYKKALERIAEELKDPAPDLYTQSVIAVTVRKALSNQPSNQGDGS